jgi:hypothetical protein
VRAQVGALRQVLPEQAVGVLVGAPLPGAARVAEVDLHARVDVNRTCSPSPSRGPTSASGAAARAGAPTAPARASRIGPPCSRPAPGRAARSGSCARRGCPRPNAGGRTRGRPPSGRAPPGPRPRPGARGSTRCRAAARALAAARGRRAGSASRARCAAAASARAERPAALHEQRQVDGLVRHAHRGVVGVRAPEPVRDLLGDQRSRSLASTAARSAGRAASTAGLGRRGAAPRRDLRVARPIVRPPAVARHLARHRRGARPSCAAMARHDSPAASPRETSSRSAALSWLGRARPGGSRRPPVRARNRRRIACRCVPKRRAMVAATRRAPPRPDLVLLGRRPPPGTVASIIPPPLRVSATREVVRRPLRPPAVPRQRPARASGGHR